MSSVQVILTDGNPLVLSALSGVLEADPRISLIATAATAQGLLSNAMRTHADIAIIDWDLPALEPVIATLRDRFNGLRFIAYGHDRKDNIQNAMSSGAAAFVARSSSPEELLDICIDVAAGKMVFPFLDVRELHTDPFNSLSHQERNILTLMSTGRTNRALSDELGISINTVKFHLSNLYDKLGVRNRSEAVAFYYMSGGADR